MRDLIELDDICAVAQEPRGRMPCQTEAIEPGPFALLVGPRRTRHRAHFEGSGDRLGLPSSFQSYQTKAHTSGLEHRTQLQQARFPTADR